MIKRRLPICLCFLLPLIGCTKSDSVATVETPKEPEKPVVVTPKVYESSPEQLLSSRLPAEQAGEGWVRLFDGYTLYGWEISGAADWSINDKTIVVDGGEPSVLCTSMVWADYELELDVRTDMATDSGLFLRCPLEPEDSGVDCYEVNLSDQDPDFPTGSIVNGQKSEFDSRESAGDWRLVNVTVKGKQVVVSIDGEEVCQYEDPNNGFAAGRIGLQHKSGKAEFRNIKVRPLGLTSLLDEDLSSWKKYPEMPGKFSVNQDGWLHVEGGRTQLESKDSYDNFVLLAEYKLPTAEMNSGIFFRCIPGDEMMGYECQLSNEIANSNPLTPADCGTGGFFRRQDARLIAGEPDQWATVLLVISGPTMAAWVNGVQVSNWYDDREPHENPRKGSRTEPGTIMIQGHDPGTDAWLKTIRIAEIN